MLWAFNPSTNQFTWMGGDYAASNCSFLWIYPLPLIICDGSQGLSGIQATPGAANIPGAREGAVGWTDKDGKLWLFSGAGHDPVDYYGDMNDLWEYQPSLTTFPAATAPIFSLKPGAYTVSGPLTISNGMANAKIYYTTDGSTPTTASKLYMGTITVSSTETVQAMAIAPGYRDSSVVSANYILVSTPATPTFSVAPGTYSPPQTLTISDTTPNTKIYYTTDGTMPVSSSPVYSGPILVPTSETITAVSVAFGNTVYDGIALQGGGAVVSATATAAYVINLPQTPDPTFKYLLRDIYLDANGND